MSKWFFSVSRMLTLASCLASISQFVQAGDFPVATRDDVLVLTSKIQATQFLNHATFGPTEAEVDALATQMRGVGTIAAASAWIDAQTSAAYVDTNSSHHLLEISMVTDDIQFGSLYSRSGTAQSNYTYVPLGGTPGFSNSFNRTRYRQQTWWHRALAGRDQLRQKMAWALAQIIAVGENANNFNEEEADSGVTNAPTPTRSRFMGLSNYYDIFVKNAFGLYREVVGRVTYHGIMGDWLSFRGNQRAANGIFPDENYAREVMQLFTIGLDMLNDDGSPQTDANGIIPTYDADDIREYAQVFTGLGYGYGTLVTTSTAFSPYTGGISATPNANVKYSVPMRMAPAVHDRSTKVLLGGLTLPARTGGETTAYTEAQANQDIDEALNGLVAHQSHPPFIVNRLIQRFVKSNPSKAYMTRVVNVFKNNGSGVRGDLKAVIKAILLDVEAWQPIRVQYQRAPINKFVVTTMGTEDSRLQEPVLTYTRFNRFFKAAPAYQVGINDATGFVFESVLNNQFRLTTVDPTFDQSPYSQPSVFNFYVSDYQPAGEITDFVPSSRNQRGALFAPEFQIVNAITSNNTGNFYRTIAAGTKTEQFLTYQTNPALLPVPHPNYSTNYENSANVTNVATKSTRTVVTYDFSVEESLLLGAVDATAAQVADSLIDRFDLYLCGGTLDNAYKASLRGAAITEIQTAASTVVGGVTAGEARNIMRGLIMCTYASPSFLVTE